MTNKEIWLTNNGFSIDGHIYCVGGGNTYLIKDELKQCGFRFNKKIGWYSSKILPIPANYKLFHFTFDELFIWDEKYNRAFPFYNIKEIIFQKIETDTNSKDKIENRNDFK